MMESEWRDRAYCRDTWDRDLDVWSIEVQRDVPWARSYCVEVCALCPVIRQCAADALQSRALGVFRAGIPLRPATSGVTHTTGTRLQLQVIANGI